MRQLIRTYSITGAHQITVTGYTFTKQDIRLIINETLASSATTDEELIASVLVSSTKKDNVTSVQSGVITLASATANLTVGDELTIEVDIDNVAKQGTDPSVTLTSVDEKIDNFYDTFDADMALQLQGIIGEEESESESEPISGNSQTEQQISALRTLQESYSVLAGNSSAISLAADVAQGKAEIAQAIEDKGGTASAAMSLSQMADAIDSIQVPTQLKLATCSIYNNVSYDLVDMSSISIITGSFNFKNLGSVKEIRGVPELQSVTDFSSFFQNDASLVKLDMHGFVFNGGTGSFTSMYSFLGGCSSLVWVDLSMSKCTGTRDARDLFYNSTLIETLVGDLTYEQVVTPQSDNTDGVYVFGGIHSAPYGYYAHGSNKLNRQSLRALINGLGDRTGETAQTLSVGSTNLAKLSADDIAVATAKGWVVQ